jgi:hypothetical protein
MLDQANSAVSASNALGEFAAEIVRRDTRRSRQALFGAS